MNDRTVKSECGPNSGGGQADASGASSGLCEIQYGGSVTYAMRYQRPRRGNPSESPEEAARECIDAALGIYELSLGDIAAGTGLNAPSGFAGATITRDCAAYEAFFVPDNTPNASS